MKSSISAHTHESRCTLAVRTEALSTEVSLRADNERAYVITRRLVVRHMAAVTLGEG
jgi:hypothetical protein